MEGEKGGEWGGGIPQLASECLGHARVAGSIMHVD